jgi:hypothetical protein
MGPRTVNTYACRKTSPTPTEVIGLETQPDRPDFFQKFRYAV